MIPVPIVLCKNEELWIDKVLRALTAVFPHVILADTGSTDGTLEKVRTLPGVTILEYANLPMEQVGLLRGEMQKVARDKFGASHVMLCDADELYPISYLRHIRDNPPPENFLSAYTYGLECGEKDNGECWVMGRYGELVGVSRQAIFSVDSNWRGVYPFESPDTFIPGDPRNFYYNAPGQHFYHIHGMVRSSKDDEVYMRSYKRRLFSLAEHPEIVPTQFWLKSRDDYKDVDL